MRAGVIGALLTGLIGCGTGAGDDLEPVEGPNYGKADDGGAIDAADFGCRIVLSELEGGEGRIDVDARLVDEGAVPALLVTRRDNQGFFELAAQRRDDGAGGFHRFEFSLRHELDRDSFEFIPFLYMPDGSRLFDHNHEPTLNHRVRRSEGFTLSLPPATSCQWTPVAELRDRTTTFDDDDQPQDGWWVTPIHATLLGDGRVLATGWERRDRSFCAMPGSARRHGISFLLDPDSMTSELAAQTSAGDLVGSFGVEPVDERPRVPGDVLYCAGHTPIADGRVLFAGGAGYQNLGEGSEFEFGLDYARLFDPTNGSFAQVEGTMQGGPGGALVNDPVEGSDRVSVGRRWYPTTTRLSDGRVLVTGGFTQCCDPTQFQNLSVELFDPQALGEGRSPWSSETLVPHDFGKVTLGSSIRDYPRVFVLPRPVERDGRQWPVAMIGVAGRVILFDPDEPFDAFNEPPGGARPGGGDAPQATAALVSTGELMLVGGGSDGSASQRIDLYDPLADSWRSVDTGIGRYDGASVLLPDGTVLLTNGWGGPGDWRQAQVFDPRTDELRTLDPWPDDPLQRGYHSVGLLLKDGRVLVAGGTDPDHDIGCERPEFRILRPPYLFEGGAPRLDMEGPEPLVLGPDRGPVSLTVRGDVRQDGGVVLMALGSYTHAFNQNQRYVPLQAQRGDELIEIQPPPNFAVAPPGDYMLHVVSERGVPSRGVHVRVQ